MHQTDLWHFIARGKRLKWSIGGGLAAIIAGALICVLVAKLQTDRVVQLVTSAGGRVQLEPWGGQGSWPVVGAAPRWFPHRLLSVQAHRSDAAAEWLPLLRTQASIRRLTLSSSKIHDSDLRHVQYLRNLESLNLEGSGITGSGLKYLCELDQLAEVSLTSTAITDEALEHLSRLPQLRELYLGDTPNLTNASLKHAARGSSRNFVAKSGSVSA